MRLKRLLLQRNEVGYALGKDHQLLFFVVEQLGVGHHHHVIQDIIELPHLSLLNHNNDLRESHCLTDLSCLILQSLHIQRSALTNRVLGLRPHQHVELTGQVLHSQLFPYHVDLFDYAWDPHEREEAVWRDPSSRHQVLVSNNADVIPLDEQQIATDNEEDTADPQYFPGRRRSQELDPDQSDIEDQFLARVRPPSAHRSVYIDEGGAASSAPAEESTATSSKGAAAPSAPARSSHSKIPKGYRSSDTPPPPTKCREKTKFGRCQNVVPRRSHST